MWSFPGMFFLKRYSRSAAISACGSNFQWEQALQLFVEMADSPDVVSVNASISSFEKVGGITNMFRYLKWRYWAWKKAILGMGFPVSISRIHTAYIGEYLHFRSMNCLVMGSQVQFPPISQPLANIPWRIHGTNGIFTYMKTIKINHSCR